MTAPNDLDSERALLGDLISLPHRIAEVMATVTPGDFYSPGHSMIFAAIVSLFESGHPVSIAAIREELTGAGNLKVCGGVQGLAQVATAGSGAWKRHAATVGRLAALRRILGLAVTLKDDAMDETSDPAVLIAEALRNLESVELPAADLPASLVSIDELIDRSESEDHAHRLPWVIPGQLRAGSRVMIIAPEGSGKALALDTRIVTPSGWTTMKEIERGDLVMSPDGKPVEVSAVTDVMYDRPCYEVTFSDGERIVADANHQWVTIDYEGRSEGRWKKQVRTTSELASSVMARDGFLINHLIEGHESFNLPMKDLPLDPYVLGAWLGDGTSRSGQITCVDLGIIEQIRAAGWQCDTGSSDICWTIHRQSEYDAVMNGIDQKISEGWSIRKAEREAEVSSGSYNLWKNRKRRSQHGSLGMVLRSMGLIQNKHIPSEYLRASEEQRMRLLAGLLDTDGSASYSNQIELTLCDPRLAGDAVELIRSLGFRPSANWSDAKLRGVTVGRRCRICFSADRPVFGLERKQERLKGTCHYRSMVRYIESVEPVPSVPVKCIMVDSELGMFLVGESMVPTHNSVIGRQCAMCIAQGIHPFMFGPVSPVRTLLVDLENPAEAITETAKPIRDKLRGRVGLYRDHECWVWHEPGGIDLRQPRWRAEFDRVLEAVQPQLVCLGPLYKAYRTSSRESDELAAAEVQNVFDDMRVRYGFALLLEHHAPKGGGGSPREMVPFGSSLWLRWPEFGLKLIPNENSGLDVRRWRGDRVQVNWPDRLDRGGISGWPWMGYWEKGMDQF